MRRNELKIVRRKRRKAGIRKTLQGTPQRPRLSVYRSSKHIYAQVIDDISGRTLVAASTCDKSGKLTQGGNREAAAAVGKMLGDRAIEAGIKQIVFDRNGYRYHGRVKALGEAVREKGLKF